MSQKGKAIGRAIYSTVVQNIAEKGCKNQTVDNLFSSHVSSRLLNTMSRFLWLSEIKKKIQVSRFSNIYVWDKWCIYPKNGKPVLSTLQFVETDLGSLQHLRWSSYGLQPLSIVTKIFILDIAGVLKSPSAFPKTFLKIFSRTALPLIFLSFFFQFSSKNFMFG